MQHEALGREAGPQREMKLAARGDVTPHALLGQQAKHGGAGHRLGGEDDLKVAMARARRGQSGPGAPTHIVLGHHIGRRAELACQLERVTATDVQMTGGVEAAAQGEHG